jgi:hypothetical protein
LDVFEVLGKNDGQRFDLIDALVPGKLLKGLFIIIPCASVLEVYQIASLALAH